MSKNKKKKKNKDIDKKLEEFTIRVEYLANFASTAAIMLRQLFEASEQLSQEGLSSYIMPWVEILLAVQEEFMLVSPEKMEAVKFDSQEISDLQIRKKRESDSVHEIANALQFQKPNSN